MSNDLSVKDSLVNLIAKIGEKITIRRTNFFDSKNGFNFSYVHSAIEKNIGKIISIVKIEGINKAKLNGVAFGRKAKLTLEQIKQLQVDRKNGMLVKDLMKKYNISKSSFYRLTTL